MMIVAQNRHNSHQYCQKHPQNSQSTGTGAVNILPVMGGMPNYGMPPQNKEKQV